jgi:hypothetical protein
MASDERREEPIQMCMSHLTSRMTQEHWHGLADPDDVECFR